jgi:cobalt-zinc-cadmium efflux system outer membrane protein
MQFFSRRKIVFCVVISFMFVICQSVRTQERTSVKVRITKSEFPIVSNETDSKTSVKNFSPTITQYFDPQDGMSFEEIARRALTNNGELIAARLEIQRAQARLKQAGLRPNPTIDFEQTTGRITGSKGESETSIGVSVPLEISGQRGRRIELARIELEATEAKVAEGERRLVVEVSRVYVEALIALRELDITASLNDLDLELAKFMQVRVNEGDTAPLELNLLQVEVERLRSRRALIEGRLQAALLKLKTLAGMSPTELLRLREELSTISFQMPASLEATIEIALRTRPDLRLARLNEEVAAAGLRLVKAQSKPDVTAFTRYTVSRSVFDETPVGVFQDKGKTLTFGVSVGIPVFNRNQGAKREAALAITQAKTRLEFVEAQVRSEVTSAFMRFQATRKALLTFETGVIARSEANIKTIRTAYEYGEFRITDLIAEQRRLVDAQREFTETLAEQYRAFTDLQTSIGTSIIK